MSGESLRIGFIPLADAAALIIAADRGFAAQEGSCRSIWCAKCHGRMCATSSISALFDAAHLLAPVAIASSLGIGHVKVPLAVPFMLGGERQRDHGVAGALCRAGFGGGRRDLTDPKISARALGARRRRAAQKRR